MPLRIRGEKLRSVSAIAEILSKEGLHELSFYIPKSSEIST